MLATVLLSSLLAGCVWDRTGQSASETWHREMAIQVTRTQALQSSVEDALQRVEQLEEVTSARGQDEIMRMETVEQLRMEVARLRGDLEVFQHEAGLSTESSGKFMDDADFRMAWLESRAEALEEALGLEPPEAPERDEPGDTGLVAEAEGEQEPGEDGEAQEEALEEPSAEAGPEELLELAMGHDQEERYRAARTIYERFLKENGEHERAAEACYRLANTWFREGEYQNAILAFQEVVDRFGSSDQVPWAMLRQGESFGALGQSENATLFYDDVIRLYPKSEAAKQARANKKR